MKTCTFFGHSLITKDISSELKKTLINLIVKENVKKFYVGNHGDFDHIVHSVLIELSKIYDINYYVVLAYIPEKKYDPEDNSPSDTILPDGIEKIIPKFAISYRNKWMIEQSDFVVTYVTHDYGGAAQFRDKAIKIGKTVININC